MAESILFDYVGKLLNYMGKSAVKEIAPYFGGRKKLEKLEQTMKMIQARLLDAMRRREGADGALVKEWLKHLKRVVYKLEDLFGEVIMDDIENEQVTGGNMLTKSLQILSSKFKINKKVAKEAKAIMEELKAIESEMLRLNLLVHQVGERSVVNLMNRRETNSFIQEKYVIGRDDDKMAIIDLILHPNDVGEGVCVIPIIGIGGLGKTTLAQFVFNDKIIQKHFDLKVWACISESSTLEEAIKIVLKSVQGDQDCHQMSMEQLQTRLRGVVNNKKYLIVLDDVWDEDLRRWGCLRGLLCEGKKGSTIIVTSRSEVVAKNMGTIDPYRLGGLSEDNSWELFRSIAFEKGQEEMNPNLTSIGREIVKKCANVPLAIQAIAGLLYSSDTEQEWEYFKNSELCKIAQNENSIMSTLKLSYDHLSPSELKHCFAYCSLFPKDYTFYKEDLIYLWMAQGFIEQEEGSCQSPEDVGHAYFMELLRRSFFQDAFRNELNEIVWCKMHDLVNDLSQNVAGDECLLLDRPTHQIYTSKYIWHVSSIVDSSAWEVPSSLLAAKGMRSLLCLSTSRKILNMNSVFSSWRCLRALDLGKAEYESLPSSIGDLRHLKYLRLRGLFEYLPEGITRLQNLQTLDVSGCGKLKEFPRGFNKIVSLRHLRFVSDSMEDMPPKFGQLTSLQSLSSFVVGQINGLGELGALNKLVGKLEIFFVEDRGNSLSGAKVGILKQTMVTYLEVAYADALELECLQPPPTLKSLVLWDCKGVRFPRWGMDELPGLLPNLVSVNITFCYECQYLPPFNHLPRLMFLTLSGLSALEYMESETASFSTPYFPSLEWLKLNKLPKLKEWSRFENNDVLGRGGKIIRHEYYHQCFPRLSRLEIRRCPELMSMPLVPKVEKLKVYEIHGNLLKHLLCAQESSLSPLRELVIESVCELGYLSIEKLVSLESLKIEKCHELINLMAESPNSLRKLEIADCERLRDISAVLQHIYIFKEFKIRGCPELNR